ncbi:hypothetical protein [Leyella stercorea]|uniref:hypothetical protein n=1 Tax=Leyella stercorea TaxID=363265 RepID=UPI002430A4B1|nr:hypothetical protein [Leyella stercorea]
MKKILSLLSMLMITVMAFATDYKGQLDYILTTRNGDLNGPSNAQGVLKIEDYAGGKYTVTATGCDLSSIDKDLGDWGEIICEGVEGTTDANGVTTIDVTPYAFRGSDNAGFKSAKLFVKFKGDKAYATFEGTYNPNFYTNYKLKYTFGVDEGFDGGGSTGGGEDKPAAFEKVNFVGDGTNFDWKIPVNWDTQKIVMSIDPSTCTGNCEDIIGLGEVATAWNNTLHLYRKTDKTLQGYFQIPGGSNNNTNPFDETNPIKVEVSKAQGFVVNGVVKIPASQMSALFALSTVNMGTGEGANDKSRATYKYVKVVDKDWTEVPPVTVKDTKKFENVAYTTSMGGNGTATVTFTEMSDGTCPMTFVSDDLNVKAENLTKGTDEKGRTTYTGKVANGTQTYDVAGVVYEKDNAERLYMTMITGVTTVVVGENPDAVTPEVTEVSNKTYTSNLRILDGEEPVVENAEAQVNIIKYSDESYKVTLKDVNILNKTQDLVFVGKAIVEEAPTEGVEPLTVMAKSDEATTTVFGEEMSGTFEITEVSADEIKMGFSMESTNFSYQGEFNYTEEETPEVYTNNLHIYDAAAPETDLFQADQAKVEFLATETGEFKLTLKDVTLNEKTQDLVFTGALPTPQPGGQEPLAEEGEGEVTPAEPAMVLNATADDATTRFFDVATYPTAVFNVSYDKNDNFMMTFTIAAGAKNYGGEFNYEKKNPDTPDPELFCKENYVADGTGFEWDINVDWDTQKIVMSIDPSTCTGSCEDVIGLGAVPTAWDNTLHLYRTSADQMLQGYFNVPGGSNNNTDKFAETAPFLVEVSKAQGFVVNNEVKIAASEMSYLFTLPTVKMGTGEGANDKSRATYNYVKVVDKDWTAPKDPDTGINATTVAEGEVEFFTVNGVKLNKLQKGLNIVRTADGKVKKVLVK